MQSATARRNSRCRDQDVDRAAWWWDVALPQRSARPLLRNHSGLPRGHQAAAQRISSSDFDTVVYEPRALEMCVAVGGAYNVLYGTSETVAVFFVFCRARLLHRSGK
jgi:hypothetical protein